MKQADAPLAGLLLVGGVAVAAAVFGVVNWRWLEQRHLLEREGMRAEARIDAVTVSHKACNSTVSLSWASSNGTQHTGRFTSCFANRSVGQTIGVRYLAADPQIAIIDVAEGGMPDSQFRTGIWLGALVAVVLGAVAVKLALPRLRRSIRSVQ